MWIEYSTYSAILWIIGIGIGEQDNKMMVLDVHKSRIPRIVLSTRECVEGLLPTRKAQQMPSIITIHTTVQLLLNM